MSKAMLFLYLCYWVWTGRPRRAALELRRSDGVSRAPSPCPSPTECRILRGHAVWTPFWRRKRGWLKDTYSRCSILILA